MASKNTPKTKPIKKIAKIKQKLENAQDLTFLPDDKLVVADKLGLRMNIFDIGGKFVQTLAEKVKPLGVSANRSGLIAFTNVNKGKCEVHIRSESGEVINQWGNDLIWKPRSIDFTHKGHLVVTDFLNHARHPVGVYTMDGQSVLKFGQSKDDNFKPWFLAVDPFDRALLADKDTRMIKIYDTCSGKLVTTIGNGNGESTLSRRLEPRGLTTDAQGNIMVCDYGSNRLAVYSPDGRFINDMLDREDGLISPYSVAFSRTGYLAIGCTNSNGTLKKIRLYQVLQSALHTPTTGKLDN